jgi:hypothetical protein
VLSSIVSDDGCVADGVGLAFCSAVNDATVTLRGSGFGIAGLQSNVCATASPPLHTLGSEDTEATCPLASPAALAAANNGNGDSVVATVTTATGASSDSAGVRVSFAPTTTCCDGVRNGDETFIDCGGSCSACLAPPILESVAVGGGQCLQAPAGTIGARFCNADGGEVVTIVGANFGASGAVATDGCAALAHDISDPSRVLLCTLKPSVAGGVVFFNIVTAEGQQTLLAAGVSFAAPPLAPRIENVTAGDGAASVAFSAADDTPVLSFFTLCEPGGVFATAASSPIAVNGLLNNVEYTCTVRSTNAAGEGAASPSSSPFTPRSLGGASAPRTVVASAGDAAVTVAFSASANDGGFAIERYEVTSTPGGVVVTGAASPITVTGLTNDVTYTFVVTPVTSFGRGESSQPSNEAMPAGGPPGRPIIDRIVPGNFVATVFFVPPLSSGGAPVAGYRVTASPGNRSATGVESPITVVGLTNGVAYRFTVQAANALGDSGRWCECSCDVHLCVLFRVAPLVVRVLL